MPDDIHYEQPLDSELYCFTAKGGDRYHTLIVTYLIPSMITNQKVLRSQTCDQTFIGHADGPMLLIPFDDEMAERWAVNTVTISGTTQVILAPTEFHLAVEPYFHYKIEHDQLYSRASTGVRALWQLVSF